MARRAKGHNHRHSRIGEVLLSESANETVCEFAFRKRDHGGPLPPGYATAFNGGNSPTTDTRNDLLPGGVLLMECSRSPYKPPTLLIAYNTLHYSVLWTKPLRRRSTYTATPRYLIELSTRVQAGHGLQASVSHHYVTAFSAKSGKRVWTTENPAEGITDFDNHIVYTPVEGPSGPAGSSAQIVLTYLGTSAYNAATGQLLWALPNEYATQASGSYVGFGTVLAYGYGENEFEGERTGFDVQTDAVKWNVSLPTPCQTDSEQIEGSVQWEFGEGCAAAFDLATGQVVLSVGFPWSDTAGAPSGLAVSEKGMLAFYGWGDLATPIWSTKASEAEPILVTPGHILVRNRRGLYTIDAHTGRIVGHVPEEQAYREAFEYSGTIGPAVDGLVAQSAEDGLTSVIDVDHP